MDIMPPTSDIILELFKTLLSIIVLLITWVVGMRILTFWEIKKKRKELDLVNSTEFHKLYGEFTTVWRLWKIYWKNYVNKNESSEKLSDLYWELLKRASAAEGGIEAILVKLSSERKLNSEEMETLGLFRQAFQQLRESIREKNNMDWQRESPEYKLLKELTSKTILIINPDNKLKSPKFKLTKRQFSSILAQQQLSQITEINSNNWKNKISKF